MYALPVYELVTGQCHLDDFVRHPMFGLLFNHGILYCETLNICLHSLNLFRLCFGVKRFIEMIPPGRNLILCHCNY